MMVSIIIPVYNIEKYIHSCVISVLTQTYQDIECILVDDGSTDHSPEICDKYVCDFPDKRVRCIHKINNGVAAARNTGLKEAKGEYVYFLDGDDMLKPEAINNFVSKIANETPCDFVIGQMASFVEGSDPRPFGPIIRQEWVANMNGKDAFISIYDHVGLVIMGVRGLYSRKFLIDNNLFFIEDLRYSEDQEWTPRLFEKAEYVSVSEERDYLYREGRPGSLMNTLSLSKMELTMSVYDGWYDRILQHLDDPFFNCLYKVLIDRYWSLFYNYTPMVSSTELPVYYKMMNKRRRFVEQIPSCYSEDYRYFLLKYFNARSICYITSLWASLKKFIKN